MQYLILFLLLVGSCFQSYAQTTASISTEGKEFYAAFMQIIPNPPNNLRFVISARNGASGTISMPSNPLFTPIAFTVGANSTYQSPDISSNFAAGSNETPENKGFYIKSNNNDISVTAINLSPNRTEASMVLPLTALGTITEYTINTTQRGTNREGLSEFTIVATADNTTLEVVPSATTTRNRLAGQPFTVTLQKGQVVQYQTTGDFTGTRIKGTAGSCRAFAVFAGSNTTTLLCASGTSSANSSQHVYEQQFPTHTWGTEYVVSPYFGLNGVWYRIVALQDATNISLNDGFSASTVTLQAGESKLTFTQIPVCIKADKAISVVQISQNSGCSGSADPSLLVLGALNQPTTQATFNTIELGSTGLHYINVIMKTSDIGLLRMNNRTTDNNGVLLSRLFIPLAACNAYSIAYIPIGLGRTGIFTTSLTASTGFSAYAYGYSNVDMYAYAVGASFENLLTNFTTKIISTTCEKATLSFSGFGSNVSSYTWDFGDGTSPLKGQTVQKTFTQSGVYNVSMSAELFGGTGCASASVVKKEVEVIVPKPVGVNAKITNARTPYDVCGTSDTLVAEMITGAKYQWLLDNQKITGATTNKLGVTKSGEYAVTVTLDTCSAATSATQKVNFLKVVAKIQGDSVQNFCENGLLKASELDSTNYTYEWYRDGQLLSAKTPTLSVTQSGSYTLNLKRSTCTALSKPIVVNIAQRPTAKLLHTSPLEACDSVLLQAAAVTNTPATYTWYKDKTVISTTNLPMLWIKTSGNYSITVKTAICTTTSESLIVRITKTPIAKITQKSPVYFCKTAQLTAQAQDSATYNWWLFGTLIASTKTPTYTATIAGTYQVQVKVGNCMAMSDTVNLLPNVIKARIIQKAPVSFCEKGMLYADSASNTANVAYEWWLNGKLVGTKPSLLVTSTGSYQLKVKQETCIDSTNLTVTVFQFPNNIVITSTKSMICIDSSAVLQVVSLPNASYQWQRNGVALPNTTPQMTVNQTGTYTVTITLVEGCSKTLSTVLSNFTPSTLKIQSITNSFKINELVVFPNPITDVVTLRLQSGMGVQLNVENGQQWRQLTWWLNNVPLQGATQPTLFATQAGTYQAKGTDSNGCPQISAPVVVTLPELPMLRYVVVNTLGQIVMDNTQPFKAGEVTTVYLGQLAAGVYWLKISGNNEEKTVRLVKIQP